jgi:hypothetical protein
MGVSIGTSLVAAIQEIRNASRFTAAVRNVAGSPPVALAPGQSLRLTTPGVVPLCDDGVGFETKHVQVDVNGYSFRLWLTTGRTDTVSVGPLSGKVLEGVVRVSADGAWHRDAPPVGGYGVVAVTNDLLRSGDLTLIVQDHSVWMLPQGLMDVLHTVAADVAKDHYATCDEHAQPVGVASVPSVPKLSASAFSMAGPPSDAFDRRQAGARFLYRDSGKRYDYAITNGRVTVQPAPAVPVLNDAISYQRKRRGEIIPLPQFDLIAANGGRVFAKEKDTNRFFFAVVDEMFVHAAPDGTELAVPSSYFKLDPELNTPGAALSDVTAHLDGDFNGHPAANRFPLYRLALSLGIGATFDVRVKRGVWHLIDARPPLMDLMKTGIETVLRAVMPVFPRLCAFLLAVLNNVSQDLRPPKGVPVYDHVKYCGTSGLFGGDVWQPSIAFSKVLDIGVGHVHLHEQYERITGGECQSQTATPKPGDFTSNYAELYRVMNGPIADLDGYNDGTCNFYVLAQLTDGTFALLYMDEQSYFSQRWRLVGPDDRTGLMFALSVDLHANPDMYGWDRAKFWSPFDDRLIGPRSRLAVAAQVVLVTGDPPDGSAPHIYSINCSWGTTDRTWRHRALPASVVQYFDGGATARGDEPVGLPPPPPNSQARPDSVYPQTIRLRGDMTIQLKGTHGDEIGRWCQRYLPASNEPVPYGDELVAGRVPYRGYEHPWKFLTETAFAHADRFSHFGVYADADSRMKYYPVDVSAQDAQTLDAVAAADPNAWWADVDHKLVLQKYDFDFETLAVPYPTSLPPPKKPMTPAASLYNQETLLRVVRRGARWIAMHWDKRDDDMLPLENLPAAGIALATKDRKHTIHVTLKPAVLTGGPPQVQTAYFWWDDANTAGIALGLAAARTGNSLDTVWRARMAALDANGTPVPLADVTFDQFTFYREAQVYYYRWAPPAAVAAQLRSYGTADAAMRWATSIWFEDITGHVAPPEQFVWRRPGGMHVSVEPAELPLGKSTDFKVHAVDAMTGAALNAADVVFDDDGSTGKAEKTLTRTFNATPAPPDPGTHKPIKEKPEMPTARVVLDGYQTATVPFKFYNPRLNVRCDIGVVPANRPVQILVKAQDDHTQQAVPARVTAGGSSGTANAAFPCTFAAGANTVRISFEGYPPATLTVNAYVPAMRVWFDPPANPGLSHLTVHAVDTTTGALVAGRVKIGGQDVAATNVPFAYTFRGHLTGSRLNRHTVYPSGEVDADGYPSQTIDFGLGDD